MSKGTYQGREVEIVRAATKADPGYQDSGVAQLLIRDGGQEKVVAKAQVQEK